MNDARPLSSELREIRRMIHKTVKKVTEDIETRFHFNTAIAATMELLNALSAAAQDELQLAQGAALLNYGLETIIILLAPFAPHLANELWEQLGRRESLDRIPWPSYSEEAMEEEKLLIVVQVNGKVRGKIMVSADVGQEQIENEARVDPKVMSFLNGKTVQRVVYVPRRLVNIVVEG